MLGDMFPIILECHGSQHQWFHYSLDKAFRRAKPDGCIYWSFDAIVINQSEVEFVVWGLYGIGGLQPRHLDNQPYKTDISFGGDVTPEEIAPILRRELSMRAKIRRAEELELEEERILRNYIEEDRIANDISCFTIG